MKIQVLLFLVVAAMLCCVTSRPSRRRRPHPKKYDKDLVGYLYEFGYLPKSDMETGKIRTQKEVRKATMMLQKFMKLPMTGQQDDDTMEMMKKPRCGVADMDMKDEDFMDAEYYSAPSQINIAPAEFALLPGNPKWNKFHVTYSFSNYSPKLTEDEIRSTLADAFKLWSDATLLSFSEETDFRKEADIKIQFGRYYHGDSYPFDEAGGSRGNVLAHAFPPGPGLQGDVHFDDYETWTIHSYEGINLLFVAVHEIGHALGLGHSEVLGSIMFPSYSGYQPDLQLHTDDLTIIQYLYGRNDEDKNRPDPPAPVPTTTTTTTTPPPTEHPGAPESFPDPCEAGIDAVALAHMGNYEESNIFMFKGPRFWRRSFTSMIESDLIVNKWTDLPRELSHVDAVYQNPNNNRLTFFSGDRFWEFDDTVLHPDTPRYGRSITELGLPSDIRKIDAVFQWGHNGKTYVITGSLYWRLSDVTGKVEAHYPRSMSMWEGVPLPVDAAFQLWDGRTYFFKDLDFYVFNDRMMSVEQSVEGSMGQYWLWCH